MCDGNNCPFTLPLQWSTVRAACNPYDTTYIGYNTLGGGCGNQISIADGGGHWEIRVVTTDLFSYSALVRWRKMDANPCNPLGTYSVYSYDPNGCTGVTGVFPSVITVT